jgi:SpoVK/Ycf46/Vps4 family AAA+-type ATPase
MAISSDTRYLIRAVADNDAPMARRWAELIVTRDGTQANRKFCENIKAKLQAPLTMLELPQDIRGLLLAEDVTRTFRTERYYLTARESELYKYIEKMYKAAQKLADMGISYLNAVMLYGESGTGKTTFGRYVAFRLGLPFAYLNFSAVISSYLGTTGKNISKVFDYVATNPCLLMLDEIDAVGLARGTDNEIAEMSRVVIALIQSLDLVTNNVLIIGATNRSDMIDKALMRRFTLRHEVKALTKDERETTVNNYLRDVGLTADERDIAAFCVPERPTAQLVNDLVQRIAESIIENAPLKLREV